MFNSKVKNISVTVSMEKCVGCGLCVERCRHNAMGLVQLKDTTYAMMVNPANCHACGRCARKCKFNAIELVEETNYMNAFFDFL